jgi:hypothetical protein
MFGWLNVRAQTKREDHEKDDCGIGWVFIGWGCNGAWRRMQGKLTPRAVLPHGNSNRAGALSLILKKHYFCSQNDNKNKGRQFYYWAATVARQAGISDRFTTRKVISGYRDRD